MAHTLFRLLNSLTNTPHLIETNALEKVISLIEDRNNGEFELAINGSPYKNSREPQYNEDTKVGIIPVQGPLSYIAYQGLCSEESASYQQIKEDFDVLCSLGAKTIVMDVDSPGGEAYACFETGQYLRHKADELGINLISYNDGIAASAGYALARCAHEMIVNPQSETGSIGVVVKLRNVNKALNKMGIEDTFITAGESKIPFNADGGFKKEFIEDLQTKVDSLYQDFVGYVSEMGDIPETTVRKTQAKMFMAQEALDIGLVNSIMNREEFANYLSDIVDNKSQRDNSMLKMKLFNKNKQAELSAEEIEEMVKLEELQASLSELTAKFEASQSEVAKLVASLASKDAELTSLQTSLKEATEKLATAKELSEKAEKEALDKKLAARKETLAKYLDAEKTEAAFAKLANVEDSIFELVVDGYKVAADLEKDSAGFKELGAGGDAKDNPTSGTTKLLKEKYKNKE